MKFKIPNRDELSPPFTVIQITFMPKEILHKAYIDAIGTDINIDGIRMKLNSVEITSDFIILDLEDSKWVRDNAEWLVWPGWVANHDKRVDDAKCSNCGYIHPTVYGALDKLSNFCAGCGCVMRVN